MKNETEVNGTDENGILKDVLHILENMIYDWDLELDGSLGYKTRLIADLEFGSIDIVQFLVAIEEHFQRRGFPFEELVMIDGRYVDEIVVDDIISFLNRHLNNKS